MAEHWFDDDSFWEAVEPFLFTEARRDAAKSEVDALQSRDRKGAERHAESPDKTAS